MKIAKPRLQFLESIRGLAALAVVLFHSALAFWPFATFPQLAMWNTAPWYERWLIRTPLAALYSGGFAVVIFFVLSGFVLSYSYFRNPRVEAVGSAALRRYFRLVLPILLSVLVSYTLLKNHRYYNVAAAKLSGSAWLNTWYQFKPHLRGWGPDDAVLQAFYGAFFGGSVSYDNALWTMSIEFTGSFLVFAFLALFGFVRNRWLIYLILGGLLLIWQNLYMFDFLLGTALCDAYVRFEVRQQLFDLDWFALPLLLLPLWFGSHRWLPLQLSADAQVNEQYYSTLGAAIVIGVPLFSTRLQSLLSVRPLALLGRISFGLYLVHLLILCSVGSAVYVRLRQVSGFSDSGASVIAVLCIVAGSIAGGWIMFYVADLPSIAFSKWLVEGLFARRPALPIHSPQGAR